MNDLQGALRQLTNRPGLSVLIVITLAIGIGANAAIFSLFHHILLKPLPVPEPEQLVNFSSPGPKMGTVSCSNAGSCDDVFSYSMLRDLEREQEVFTGIAAHRGFSASIAAEGMQAVNGEGASVNGSYFSVLRLVPAVGRLIGPQDEPRPGEGHVVVLSYDYWQNNFGGDRSILGKILTVNGQPLTVIGVAPEGFTGTTLGERPQVFVPLTLRWLMEPFFSDEPDNRRAYWAYLFARLKPGVSSAQAEDAINLTYRSIITDVEVPLNAGMSEQAMVQFREKRLVLRPGERGQSSAPDDARLPLTLLLSVTALVLVIACVNIANLLLTRGAARAGEMAVRSSLGASRGRMVLQLLVEAGVLGLTGCLVALPLAALTLKLVAVILPPEAATQIETGLSGAAVLFAFCVSLVTVLLFGLFPALATTQTSPVSVLKEQGGRSGGRGLSRFRSGLATMQIAFSMVLLVLAGLFAQSLANVSRVDLGISADPVASMAVSPVLTGYSPERSTELFRRIKEDLEALPGVVSVAASMVPVVSGNSWGGNVSVQGFEANPDTDTDARYNSVGPGFFRTLQIPFLAGRDFTDADTADRPRVAIVNEAFANKFGLGSNPVGKRMAVGATAELDIEIVGLVKDAKYSDVKEDVPAQYFLARAQNPELGFTSFYVRTELEPRNLLPAMAAVVTALDADLPVEDLSTLPALISETLVMDRLIGMLSGGFAMLATVLAALGLYGVLSYSVAQRTRELGLRQALGATPARLQRMVLRQVGWMGLVGGLTGLLFALLLGRAAESVLFGLSGFDPGITAFSAIVLGGVVLAAGYLPARHASSTHPIEALRYE